MAWRTSPCQRAREAAGHPVPIPLVEKAHQEIQVEVRLTGGGHGQKGRLKAVVSRLPVQTMFMARRCWALKFRVSMASVREEFGPVQLSGDPGGDDIPDEPLLVGVEGLVADAHVQRHGRGPRLSG